MRSLARRRRKTIIVLLMLIVLSLLLDILVACLFLVSNFTFVPEWVTIVATVWVIGLSVYVVLRRHSRPFAKVILPMLATLCGAYSVYTAYDPTARIVWNSRYYAEALLPNLSAGKRGRVLLTGAEAVADLDFAYHKVSRLHPALLDTCLSRDFHGAYARTREELLSAPTVAVVELRRKIQALYSSLGDAHTSVFSIQGDGNPYTEVNNRLDGPMKEGSIRWKDVTYVNGESIHSPGICRRAKTRYQTRPPACKKLRLTIERSEKIHALGRT